MWFWSERQTWYELICLICSHIERHWKWMEGNGQKSHPQTYCISMDWLTVKRFVSKATCCFFFLFKRYRCVSLNLDTFYVQIIVWSWCCICSDILTIDSLIYSSMNNLCDSSDFHFTHCCNQVIRHFQISIWSHKTIEILTQEIWMHLLLFCVANITFESFTQRMKRNILVLCIRICHSKVK